MPINTDNHPTREQCTLAADQRIAICRCWKSKKFPYCDGSHRCFNDDNNDQLGPMIVCGHQYQPPQS